MLFAWLLLYYDDIDDDHDDGDDDDDNDDNDDDDDDDTVGKISRKRGTIYSAGYIAVQEETSYLSFLGRERTTASYFYLSILSINHIYLSNYHIYLSIYQIYLSITSI